MFIDSALLNPVLECVDRYEQGFFRARFGYENGNFDSISVPVGSENQFTPGPQDRGQPTQFLSGRIVNAFSVDFDGSELRWRLGISDAVATSNSPSCCVGTIDLCGECNGASQCLDCNGVPFGTASLDRCGICEGDGKSCLGCTDTDVTNTLLALDGAALRQRNLVRTVTSVLLKRNRGNKSIAAFAQKVRKQAEALYIESWHLAYSIPLVVTNCTNVEFCVQTDNIGILESYNQNSQEFKDLVTSVVRKLRASRSGKDKLSNAYLRNSSTLHDENLKISATVPRFQSSCK